MLNASRAQTNDLLKQFDTHLMGLTEEQAYTQQMTVGLNEVTHEKPLTGGNTFGIATVIRSIFYLAFWH